MAAVVLKKTFNSVIIPNKSTILVRSVSSSPAFSTATQSQPDHDDDILIKSRKLPPTTSVSMPMSSMTGSIVGKRFYKEVTTRPSEDGNGWFVMLDYRTLKTPSKKPLKCPTLLLAQAIAAEWEYQRTDGIRPFTMPLMKHACTALERVPLTRPKIIDNLMSRFHQDLVFCRAPDDNILTSGVHELQVKKINPFLEWVESEFGFKPVVYSSFFGGKQEDGLVKAIEKLLKKTDDCELAAIDALASASHSLIISIGIFRGKLQIDEAIELIRVEEDMQVERWGLVEGGHDLDVADLKMNSTESSSHVTPNNEEFFLASSKFESDDQLLASAREFYGTKGYGLTIRNSKRGKFVILQCDRSGSRRDISSSEKNKKRSTGSRLINCPFRLTGKKGSNGSWVFQPKNLTHNHEPSTDTSGHPTSTRRNPSRFEHVESSQTHNPSTSACVERNSGTTNEFSYNFHDNNSLDLNLYSDFSSDYMYI